jgi:hypothetical protein
MRGLMGLLSGLAPLALLVAAVWASWACAAGLDGVQLFEGAYAVYRVGGGMNVTLVVLANSSLAGEVPGSLVSYRSEYRGFLALKLKVDSIYYGFEVLDVEDGSARVRVWIGLGSPVEHAARTVTLDLGSYTFSYDGVEGAWPYTLPPLSKLTSGEFKLLSSYGPYGNLSSQPVYVAELCPEQPVDTVYGSFSRVLVVVHGMRASWPWGGFSGIGTVYDAESGLLVASSSGVDDVLYKVFGVAYISSGPAVSGGREYQYKAVLYDTNIADADRGGGAGGCEGVRVYLDRRQELAGAEPPETATAALQSRLQVSAASTVAALLAASIIVALAALWRARSS